MKKRLVALFAMVALLFSATLAVFPATAAIQNEDWMANNPNAPDDYAYSFAFVGDTQVLSMLDAGTIPEEYNGTTKKANVVYPAGDTEGNTRYMDILYDWLIANKNSKKIEYVFGLGDITENITCAPDAGTGVSTTDNPDKQNNLEWEIAAAAIKQLDGVIPYSLACGNHDVGAGFNKYFNNSPYLDQFTNNNGGYRGTAITTFRELILGEHKYLIITLPYAPKDDSLEWAAGILGDARFANHKAIITTHAYLTNHGELINETGANHSTSGDNMWYNYFSKYANVFMIVAGHVGVTDPVITYKTGDHGNLVTQILIDPQNDDIGTKSSPVDNGDGTTTTTITTNPTGMVAMFYFSENGKVVDIEYVSTIRAAKGLSPYLKESNQRTLDYRIDTLRELDKHGYEYYNVSLASFTPPTIDGVINSSEYKAAYSGAPMGTSSISERFAYDNTNLYFAFSYKLPDGPQPTSIDFNFSAQDSPEPTKNNTTVTYNLTNNTYNVTGYGVSSGDMAKADIAAKANIANGILSLEIAVNIDAIQDTFTFSRQTVSYTLETNTGDKREVHISKSLSDILAEDYYENDLTTLPQHIVFDYNSRTAFKELGHSHIYLGDTKKTPTLDGVVNSNEYLYKNTVAKNDLTSLQAAISVDINEYLSYDDDYIYAAMVYENDVDTANKFYFNIHGLKDGSYNSAARISFIVTLDENGTVTKKAEWRAPGTVSKYMSELADEKWSATAVHNAQTNTTTVEFKFDKQAVTNMLKVDSLEYFGYSLVAKGAFRYWNYSKISQKSAVVNMTNQWEGRTQADNQFLPIYVHLSAQSQDPVVTRDAASIRLSDPSGLRFATEIDKNYLNGLISKYGANNVTVGTLIAPTDTLTDVDFNITSLDTRHIPYLNITASSNNPFQENGDTNIYTAAIVNIKPGNLDRKFSAVGYVAYTDNGVTTYAYSNTTVSRSVSDVAQAALDDLSEEKVGKYAYEVESIPGYYSPYSTEDRKVLLSLLFTSVKDPFESDIFFGA